MNSVISHFFMSQYDTATQVWRSFRNNSKDSHKHSKYGKRDCIHVGDKKSDVTGKVFLIGAGVGDPELLTLKAYRLIQSADVILVDWLVADQLYDIFPRDVKRIFVGKKCGKHSVLQTDICELLVSEAQKGKTVVRLKGGDPSIFGRLAEETQVLSDFAIPFAIVPGVTAANACAAYSGIPLTHRNCAQSVRFITAHQKNKQTEPDWESLAKDCGTLVFYMGLNRVSMIANRLMEHGMDVGKPIAVIDQGASNEQKVVTSTVRELNPVVHLAEFTGPALIVVGEVVKHRQLVELALLAPKYAKVVDYA